MAEGKQETMKAVVYEEYGDVSKYKYIDTPKPTIGDNDVLIQVKAAGINPVDHKLRQGWIQAWPQQLPIIPGWDVSGVVAATGANVDRLKVGDEVYSYTRPAFDIEEYKATESPIGMNGTFAEFVAVHEFKVALKPANLSHEQAAAVPLAAMTAYQAIFAEGGSTEGTKLLVINASGGVGSFAVQIAKAKGLEVVGICSGRNREFVEGLGATVVDYTDEDFEAKIQEIFPGGADVVFDAFGGEQTEMGFRNLKEGGKLVSIANWNLAPLAEAAGGGRTGSAFLVGVGRTALEELTVLLESGDVNVAEVTSYPLSEIQEASKAVESHRTRGKIVLIP